MPNDEGSPNNSLLVSKKAHWVLSGDPSYSSAFGFRHSRHLALLADESYRYYLTADDHRHVAPCAVVRVSR
jgi:predicted N-acetyltransferase YhbS